MLYGPDYSSSDEEGLSDDNDYYEFKKRIKNKHNQISNNDSEAEYERKKFQNIMSAISYGKLEAAINEFDKGLNINVDLGQGWTPLLLSANVANEKIIYELLKRGADVNQSRDSLTPLMLLCNNSSEDKSVRNNVTACIKLLVDNGADVNAIDNKRRSAFMMAAYNGYLEAVKLLLPYIEKETEDNQQWTALFWAVEGHRTEIVDLLLKEGFSCDKTDVRGNTVMDIAHINGFEDVIHLFPKDQYNDDFCVHLNNNYSKFENIFQNNDKSKPLLFMDIYKILYGARSESILSLLQEKKINLFEFLSLNDSKLKEIGVQLPYQRNRIVGGLFKFHKHPFQAKSIPFVKKKELYSNVDVASVVLSCIRQLIAMEASLKFTIENCVGQLSPSERKEIRILIFKIRSQINALKLVSQQLITRAEMWDLMLQPADRIAKKRRNIPWCNLCLLVGIVPIMIFTALKFS